MAEAFEKMQRPMNLLTVAQELLRRPGRIVYELKRGNTGSIALFLLVLSVLCLLAYGVTVGMFTWGAQLWAAPLKITVGMLASALICLPSLIIFSSLAGTETRIDEICGLLVGMVALTSLLLIGFAPVSWIFSQSTESAAFMGTMHLIFWAVGISHGLRFMSSALRFLDGRPKSRLVVWSIIFIMVSLQMATTLRPIVGESAGFFQTEKKFFLTHWFDCLGGAERE